MKHAKQHNNFICNLRLLLLMPLAEKSFSSSHFSQAHTQIIVLLCVFHIHWFVDNTTASSFSQNFCLCYIWLLLQMPLLGNCV